MKGKNKFTHEEILKLKDLINIRVTSDKYTQKRIRDEMREIGFYGGDDFGIYNLQLNDFENLLKIGKISIIE